MDATGQYRYFYEYLFHQSLHEAEPPGSPVLASGGRSLRNDFGARLAEAGYSVDGYEILTDEQREAGQSPRRLGWATALRTIDDTLEAGLPDHQRLFDEGVESETARRIYSDFRNQVRPKQPTADTDVLPVSPYDPRWSMRSTMLDAGTELRYIDGATISEHTRIDLDGNTTLDGLSEVKKKAPQLKAYDGDSLTDAGPFFTVDDVCGLSALRPRISADEYKAVRQHLVDGARIEGNNWDLNRYMSQEAVERSAAILDELRYSGTSYTVKPDLRPGQLKAEISGTKASVRITDTRDSESYIGRVYEDGVVTRFSTNARGPGNSSVPYTPRPDEVADLLRFSQGREVTRDDGSVVGDREQGEAYYTGKSNKLGETSSFHYKSLGARDRVVIYRDSRSRTQSATYYSNSPEGREKAESDLREAVSSARENFDAALEIDRLAADYSENAEAAELGEHFPEFSGDTEIAAIQRSYWDVLRGAKKTLLRPGVDAEQYLDAVGSLEGMALEADQLDTIHDMRAADLAYTGDPETIVRAHAADVVDEMVGTYDPREASDEMVGTDVMKRFNPAQVANRMTSEHGVWQNSANLVSAMRSAKVPGDELMGSGPHTRSMRERLVAYDESRAVAMSEHQDPFIQRVGEVISETMQRNGAEVTDLSIDESGVVQYQGNRFNSRGEPSAFTGEIGQIFTQGEQSEVTTDFASGENYMFVPGYQARVLAQKPGERLSVEERTRLIGYEQSMTQRLQQQIASDLMTPRTEVGEPSSLNGLYRELYDIRHETDYIQRYQQEGLSESWSRAVLATEASRVRYPNEMRDGSTIYAAWRDRNGMGPDMTNDNHFDPFVLSGGKNMAIMDASSDGYFDPTMTSSQTNQGITRYLVESASVDSEGRIIAGEEDDRAPLMKQPGTETMRFDPWDRQQMSASNLLNASAVSQPVGTAMMTFGAWTADDPVVVSSDFASQYQVRGADGEMRDLVPGDKVSDFHGNKGVISLVVDRHLDPETIEDPSTAKAISVFRDNPDLDVVMSPFSAVSRFNGGSARELMDGEVSDISLSSVGRDDITGGLGSMSLIITHKDVESGTRVYDDAALAAGAGRKASSQLAWALGSKDCDEIMGEFYGPNAQAATNYREYLITMGMDMDPDGTLRIGYDDMNPGADRHLFEMPELIYGSEDSRSGQRRLNAKMMGQQFGEAIDQRGGDMEIPFPLEFPTTDADGAKVVTPKATDSTYKLPVLSSHLRSGQQMEDGISSVHDFTHRYKKIFAEACKYRHAAEQLENPDLDAKTRARFEDVQRRAPAEAQASFNALTSQVRAQNFDTKSNLYKESLMSSRLPDSATAVWTSDPRLDIDEVTMGEAMADQLGVESGDSVLIWRDPVLRDAGVRYMEVTTDPRLVGVAINPAMAGTFDGDFDGDSVAVVKLQSQRAKEQAKQKLSVEANLLDTGTAVDPDKGYPLTALNTLDTKMSEHEDPVLAEAFDDMRLRANDSYESFHEGEISQEQYLETNRGIVHELSEHYRAAWEGQFGGAALRFDSVESHMDSVHEYVEAGAKGSAKKFENYAHYFGAEQQEDGAWIDHGVTLHDREEEKGSMEATGVKSHGTGIAGAVSQRGVRGLRNDQLKAVLELTYPVTQSVLQIKHDPAQARNTYDAMMTNTRALWSGQKMERSADGWTPVSESGEPVQATGAEWAETFKEFYSDSVHGLNVEVNPEYVDLVAEAMTDPATGKVVDIEDIDKLREIGRSPSPMDRLAYTPNSFELTVESARDRQNIFDGSKNGQFAPIEIRQNQNVQQLMESEKVSEGFKASLDAPEVVAARDVVRDDDRRAKPRNASKRTDKAVAVAPKKGKPRAIFTPIEPEAETSMSFGD